MRNRLHFIFFTYIALCLPINAQSIDPSNKHIQIPRVANAPTLDGEMSPGEWNMAALFDDFHEMRPVEYSEPEEYTRIYAMYTEDALYIAAYSYDDNPDEIVNRRMRHSTPLRDEDHIYVMIDPFNNKRSGYMFETNANGIRNEALYTGASSLAFDWTGIWNTAAKVVEDGWIAEMEIPFKTLNLDPSNDTWGLNVRRNHPASQSFMAWYSRNGQLNPANAGTMSGFADLDQGMGLDVIPSFSTTHKDNRTIGSDTEYSPSIDIGYKLTPQLNLTLTWNTDFAATEVDSIELDLGRFSPRLAERRSFCLTDMNVFTFGSNDNNVAGDKGPDPFFSRRIGLSPTGAPVDLIGGAKLSGRLGNFDVGTLIIRQDEFQAVDATDIFVGRIKHGLLHESEIGVIYAYGDPASNDNSATLGADFTYRNTRLPNNRSLTSSFWIQQTDNPGLDSKNLAWNAEISMPSNNSWYASARIQEVQENFDNRLGFNNRTGVRQYALGGGNKWILDNHSWLQSVEVEAKLFQYDYLDGGDLQSREFDMDIVSFETLQGDEFGIDTTHEKQVLRPGDRAPLAGLGAVILPGEYKFAKYGVWFSTSGGRPWNATIRSKHGEFYTGDLWEFISEFGYRPNKYLSFNINYDLTKYDLPDGTFFTRVMEFENQISLSPNLTLANLVQYENVSDSLGFNSRFRWNFQAGQDLWLVLSHGMVDEDEDGKFARVETAASFKIRYTFRY